MAEKDTYYYYEQAKNARENGNERLAQIMENYARQIDPVYQDRAVRGGFADPQEPAPAWTPNRNTNAPTRAEYEARQQQPTLQQRYNQYADIQNAQSAKQGYVDQSDWEDPAVYQDMQNATVTPSNTSAADFRRSEDNYAPPQQSAPAQQQQAEQGVPLGVRYIDSNGKANDFVMAKQKPYSGNKLQKAAQAYYGGGVEFNTPGWLQRNANVSQEELANIGMYDPNAMASQEGQRGLSWKQKQYPQLHNVINEGEGYDY